VVTLGLFNWTTDLSDEPEYPPIFDDLWAGYVSNVASNNTCLVSVIDSDVNKDYFAKNYTSYGQMRKNEIQIGMMEVIGGPNGRYGKEAWGELERIGDEALHLEGSFMHMILNEPVLIMWKSPYEVLPLTPEDSVLNFSYWESEEWWICINQEWNAQLAKILERNSPEVMKEFADCRVGRRLNGMTVGELKGLLKEAGKSVSGKKEDLVKRLIDNNLI